MEEGAEEHGRLSAGKSQIPGVLDRIHDFAYIAQADRSAHVPCDDERLIFVSLEKLVGIGEGPRLLGVSESALCEGGVGGLQRFSNRFQTDSIAIELIGVHFDRHGGSATAG